MKTKLTIMAVWTLAMSSSLTVAEPLGSAFNYQGRLAQDGQPASGIYDFQFTLYDAITAGNVKGGPLPRNAVALVNGLFSVTLDFGADACNWEARWLEIAVRTNLASAFTTLTPRQPLTAAPYSLFSMLAANASTAATALAVASNAVSGASIADASITVAKIASGQVVKSLNGLTDTVTFTPGSNVTFTAEGNGVRISAVPATVITNAGWGLSGNTGTTTNQFLGTIDSQHLELRAGNRTGLRIQPAANGPGVNLIANLTINGVADDAVGAVIAGGGNMRIQSGSPLTYILEPNFVDASFGAIVCGFSNRVAGIAATVAGGARNQIQTGADYAFLGTGEQNAVRANAHHSTIAGGLDNQVGPGAFLGAIGGGTHNRVNGPGGTVPGGNGNEANGYNTFAAGTQAHAAHDGSFVWADNVYQDFASSGPNQFLVRAGGGVGINTSLPQTDLSVAGGMNIDQASLNTGTATNMLAFGSASGEGIGSKLTPGEHRFGLDFYTGFSNRMTIANSGSVGIGTAAPVSLLHVNGEATVQVLTIVGGADLAEPFEIGEGDVPEGAVVSIDDQHPGKLKLSERAYDTCVAGVVSGANGIRPGLRLTQKDTLKPGQNVALSGRVYVRADASRHPIKPGDLLTSADTPGYAMRATEPGRAQGAVLGKAMTGLSQGKGFVLVLVTLQ